MSQVPADCPRQHQPLKIAPLLDQPVDLIALRNPGYILLDDRSLIECRGHIVTGCSNQLDAARKGGVVWLGSGKGGQKGVMHVDNSLGIRLHKFRRQHLHIAGQNYRVNLVRGQQFQLLLFYIFLRCRSHRPIVKWDTVKLRQRPCVLMIADDQRQVAVELFGFVAMEQVCQAMQIMRTKNSHVLRGVGKFQLPVQRMPLGQRRERRAELCFVKILFVGRKLDPHEEQAQLHILMLIGIQNIGVIFLNQEVGDGGDQAFAVRTINKQNRSFRHIEIPAEYFYLTSQACCTPIEMQFAVQYNHTISPQLQSKKEKCMFKGIVLMAALATGLAPMASAQLNSTDKAFAMKLAKSNNYEIKAAQMAQDMSTNDSYKSYAQMILTDHTKAGQDLTSTVATADSSMQLPTDVSANDQSHLDVLKNAGKSFDVKYRYQMISTHIAALKLAQNYIGQPNDNPQLKKFAQDLIPVFQKHLAEAEKLPRQ